ncbi:nitrogenase component 1 [Anaerocolumna sp.]|uniref:nitrogenase component 1 n=1 Tax=Anaerocolumna sp. TaxID=2041569 RepID=UPI0028AA0934|nr:nitrogenase component 1 [Anaerocolumna sp.]
MGLYKYSPEPSGRMGLLWTVGTVSEAVLLEFGSMGHMIYGSKWMQQTGVVNKSKLYSTHIDEKDIALGITKRVNQAFMEIMEKDHPKAIFVLPSTIPETIGTDMEAICEELSMEYEDIPIITFKSGGFNQKQNKGMEEGMYKLVRHLPKSFKTTARVTYNILGSCPDLSKFQPDVYELKRILQGAFDIEPICILPSHASVSQIEEMGSAHINLVLREEGKKAAKELEKHFGTPYLQGRPYGYKGTMDWLKRISETLQIDMNQEFINKELEEGKYAFNFCKQIVAHNKVRGSISVGGNIDVVNGILQFACDELGMNKKLAWCDCKEYGIDEIPYWDEDTWIEKISPNMEGILMSSKKVFNRAGRKSNMTINRGLNEWNLNIYDSPYVGFRGAMNLCSLWAETLMEN